jgi:6-phosphofructokinase 1
MTLMTLPRHAFYAQSGGVTAVINATAAAVIETALRFPRVFGKVLAGRNGIVGALQEELIDTSKESAAAIRKLKHTPGGAFGSCRYKLNDLNEKHAEFERLINVFRAHNIGYFFYNGGGDSQNTVYKVAQASTALGYPLTCIGIPKTIDNDLPFTDCCPGFGSVAKYVAISTREAALDVKSMAATSTRVFIFEVMGRHAGWIAAASGLAASRTGDAPHIILFPEIPFEEPRFLEAVKAAVTAQGYCVVVASEGVRDVSGRFLAESGMRDAFGHSQLGGVAPILASLVQNRLGYKHHWAVADYLQRSARHIASKVDVAQAYAVGKAAVELAAKGQTSVMPTIVRRSTHPYRWTIGTVPLLKVANVERKLPRNFITKDGFNITQACRNYLEPLIQGENYPPYRRGLPDYIELKNRPVKKRLPPTNTP